MRPGDDHDESLQVTGALTTNTVRETSAATLPPLVLFLTSTPPVATILTPTHQ